MLGVRDGEIQSRAIYFDRRRAEGPSWWHHLHSVAFCLFYTPERRLMQLDLCLLYFKYEIATTNTRLFTCGFHVLVCL